MLYANFCWNVTHNISEWPNQIKKKKKATFLFISDFNPPDKQTQNEIEVLICIEIEDPREYCF